MLTHSILSSSAQRDDANTYYDGPLFKEAATRCSAAQCLCPHGREHAERRRRHSSAGANAWAIVRCSLCGSGAHHLRCAGFERLLETSFVCAACTPSE